MIDRYGRLINYLRVSVTDRCNLRCRHCMPPSGIPSVGHAEIMRFEEIARVVRVGAGLGISKIKLTGGDPLIRRGLVSLVRELRSISGIDDVTLTTNGVLLAPMVEELADAGISSVNVSMHAANAAAYESFTGVDAFPEVLRGIARARESGMKTKINCVVVEGVPIDDYVSIAGLARETDIDVRFIEMMPVGLGSSFATVSSDSVLRALEDRYGPSLPSARARGNGPATYREFSGFIGAVGFIAAMSHSFCASCNRVRLTATGDLKTCLFDPRRVSLRDAMRGGCSDEFLSEIMLAEMYRKPGDHGVCAETAAMAGIGG